MQHRLLQGNLELILYSEDPTCNHIQFLDEGTIFMIQEPMKQSAFSSWFDWLVHGEEYGQAHDQYCWMSDRIVLHGGSKLTK